MKLLSQATPQEKIIHLLTTREELVEHLEEAKKSPGTAGYQAEERWREMIQNVDDQIRALGGHPP